MNFQRIIALVTKDLKTMIRAPAALFLVILFPIIITLAFGVSFGAIGGSQSVTYDIGLIDMDSKEYPEWSNNFIGNLTSTDILRIVKYDDNETAQNELIQGNLQGLIVIPREFGESSVSYWNSHEDRSGWVNTTIKLYLDSGSLFATQAIKPIIQQILDISIYGLKPTLISKPIDIETPLIEVKRLTTFDFFAPGLFAFAVIFLTMTVALSFAEDRERGLLRRINTTPTSSSEYMASQTISNMVLAIIQAIVVFLMAFAVGYRPLGDFLSIAMAFIIIMVFSLCCVGFGLITATISKSPGSANGIAFIFIMPQMFLGTFVSIGLSSIAQEAGKFVPSYYVTDALTTLFLRGAPISSPSIITDFSILLVISVLVLLTGILLFRKYSKI